MHEVKTQRPGEFFCQEHAYFYMIIIKKYKVKKFFKFPERLE